MGSPAEREIWLRGNRRAIVAGSALPAILGTIGLFGALNLFPVELTPPLRIAAGILALLSALVGIVMANQSRLPRLAYANRELLVYAGPSKPIRVPIDVVEVFFGGQGATEVQVPGHKIESKNIVVRLAERHREWHERKIRASFGRWQDGYISLNGAWCEPISAELVKSLNHKLVETKRAVRNADGLPDDQADSAADAQVDGCGLVGGSACEDPAE